LTWWHPAHLDAAVTASIISSSVALTAAVIAVAAGSVRSARERHRLRRSRSVELAQAAALDLREALLEYGDAVTDSVTADEAPGSFAVRIPAELDRRVAAARQLFEVRLTHLEDDRVLAAARGWRDEAVETLMFDRDRNRAAEQHRLDEFNRTSAAALRGRLGRTTRRTRRQLGITSEASQARQ